MDLIEYFGSYEKAKGWIEVNAIDVDWLQLGKYRKELLEYRRANNIFEVGDFIVSTLEPDTWWKSEVMRIKHIHKNMFICESKHGDVHQYNVCHASDAEIEAGHRLPEKDKDV